MVIKRPILTWLIGLWVFIQYKAYVIYPLDRITRINEIPRESMSQWRGLGIILALVLCIAIIRMQNKARYIAVACLSLAFFMLARLTIIFLIHGKYPPLGFLIYISLSLLLNPFSIWYLIRPSYGKKCDKYWEQKFAKKQIKFEPVE